MTYVDETRFRRCNGRVGAIVAATAYAFSIQASAASEPKVVVTIKPVHSLVSQLLTGVTEPRLIVEGSASPHTFSLKPSAAKSIMEADIFIRVSQSVEPFSQKLVEALPKSVAVLTLVDAEGIKLLDRRDGGAFDEHSHEDKDHDHHQGHDDHNNQEADSSHKDGHIWLDPDNAKVMAKVIAATLSAKFPDHKDKLSANLAQMQSDLDKLAADVQADLAPVRGQPFILFHDATQYFEKRFGVEAAGSITVSPDQQPSAKRLRQVRSKIAKLGATCVFAEPSFQPKLLAAVVEGSAAKTGTLDPEAQSLAPGPGLYAELLRGLAQNVRRCLKPAN